MYEHELKNENPHEHVCEQTIFFYLSFVDEHVCTALSTVPLSIMNGIRMPMLQPLGILVILCPFLRINVTRP